MLFLEQLWGHPNKASHAANGSGLFHELQQKGFEHQGRYC
jgi:hypothetical protein